MLWMNKHFNHRVQNSYYRCVHVAYSLIANCLIKPGESQVAAAAAVASSCWMWPAIPAD
jgi:hypothetical protein